MNDSKYIIPGLIIAIGIFAFPLWYNFGHKSPSPQIVLSEEAKAAGACILPAKEMRVRHMLILDQWRSSVVRDASRTYASPSGKQWHMSLSNTCLGCHTNRDEFCERCHSYASVRTYCWDCHVDPAKGKKEIAEWKKAEELSSK